MQRQVLLHGQLAIERERLRHVAHTPACGHVAWIHRLAEQLRLALAGRQQAGQHLHGGGLAAAVGAQEAEDLAALDAKAHMVHRHEVAEAHRQILRFNGDVGLFVQCQRFNHDFSVGAPFFFRQQGDEGRFERMVAGAIEQFSRRAGGQHPAVVHGHQPVEALGFFHVGRGHQHAHAGAVGTDAGNQLPELRPRQRVDAGGRLVQDQQVRVVDEGAAQPELLLHAARELAGRARQKGVQAGAVCQRVDAAPAFIGIMAEQAGEELQVFLHRQGGVEVLAQALRHVGNARAHRLPVPSPCHVAAQHLDAPLLDGARAGHQGHQAGFAYAVRADQPHHAPRRDVQRDVLQRGSFLVVQ